MDEKSDRSAFARNGWLLAFTEDVKDEIDLGVCRGREDARREDGREDGDTNGRASVWNGVEKIVR